MWLDSHCHVTAHDFDADRGEVLARAFAGGVDALLAVGAGYGVESNGEAVALALSEPRVFAAVGVHPHDAKLWDERARGAVRGWLGSTRVVAVGECGLDYHYEHSPRELQRRAFEEQLELARELDRPVSIHVRDDGPAAYEDLLAIWRAAGGGLEGVLHCYTGTLEFARRALEHGLRVSFSGILTFKRDRGLREVARGLPLERLLVETDAPFLAPEGLRGRRNEPLHVARVGETLSTLHGVDRDELAGITSANARSLFRLPSPVAGAA